MVPAAADLKMKYDREADVLYCSFGDPQPALSVEQANGVIVRVKPDTNEVVGITIVDFFKRFMEHPDDAVSVQLTGTASA